MQQLSVYIAGPMSGLEDFNFPAFNQAEQLWKAKGWRVVNPASFDDGDTSQTWLYYMARDLPELIRCDAIAMLPNWKGSRGAELEHTVAIMCGLRVFDALHPATHPITDHKYIEGTNICCDAPDYIHLAGWKNR